MNKIIKNAIKLTDKNSKYIYLEEVNYGRR